VAQVSSIIATSGTAVALAGAARVVERGGESLKGRAVSRAAVACLAEMLARRDVQERSELPGIGPRRAEIARKFFSVCRR